MFAILIAFASGALVTGALFWWWTRRAAGVLSAAGDGPAGGNRADAPASAADAVSLSTASAARLQQLAEGLAPVGEASAHPRDLMGHPMFREAVGLLESDAVTLTTCADYATGANWPLSAAAFAALRARADGAQAVPVVIARLQALRPWPMYYALQYLAGLDRPPAPGLVMLRCEDWWGDHPFMPAFLTEFFDSFATRGLPVSFGDALPTATPAQRQTTEDVIKKLDHPAARALLEELLAFRRGAIDREFLQTFGRFVEDDPARLLLVEHDAIRDILTQGEAALYRQPPRSLLVVGEPRCGKSSVLSLIGERARAAGWVMFEAGGVELQAGQMYLGELEERLRRLKDEIAVEKRVLWHAPDFMQLAMSGTHRGQTASMLDQLLPAITAGRIVLLSEITPTALTTLLQQRPSVRTAVELLRLRALMDDEMDRLAGEVAGRMAQHTGVAIAPEVLQQAAYLARHYLGAAQTPGALLDLLKLSARRAVAHDAPRVAGPDVLATVAQLTGMPAQILDDRERVDLATLRRYFSSRVIGQDEAVDAVVDRIAMLKAGLTDPAKPIAVFLFAGPTGTGKTELAKTLAQFLFGSAERLIRLDMSEFQTPEALRKIVGEAGTPDQNQALTDRVRKGPFSIVLLDEFEKAHSSVWDLFLQVFDDGRLTDANGHTVDFRHCLIIMTSNVGSTIRQDAGTGFVAHTAAPTTPQVMKAIRQSFRPEFVNRIDRIIVFRPLGRDQMRSIITKELSLVLQRRGLRNREWAVEWEPSALEFLLDKGFSHAMGARPLRRAIDQHLLSPLAATLVEHRFPEGDQFLFVRSDGRALQVEFVDPDADGTPAAALEPEPVAGPAGLGLSRLILHPAGTDAERLALGRELNRLERRIESQAWTEAEGELSSLMQRPDFWDTPERPSVLARFEVIDRVRAALRSSRSLAGRLDRSASVSGRYSKDLIARLASQLLMIDYGIDDALTGAPVDVMLSVQPVMDHATDADPGSLWQGRLLDMYRRWAARRGMQLEEVKGPAGDVKAIVVSGFGAARLLAGEAGLHVLDYEDGDDSRRAIARVVVRSVPLQLPDPPHERQRRLLRELEGGTALSTVVRRYRDGASPVVRDLRHGWRTGHAELVFDGHFDLIGAVWPGAAQRT